jgi:hypothetical protein
MPLKKLAKIFSPAYSLMSILKKGGGKGGEESPQGRGIGRGMVGRLAREASMAGSAEPEEGAPEVGRPRGRGMLGRIPMSAGLLGQVAADRSMRGASTQGMKSGGKVKGFRDGGIYTAEMGQPPQDIDGGSAPRKAPAKPKATTKPKAPPKPVKPVEVKKAKGGSIDGIAQRGKTNCKMR